MRARPIVASRRAWVLMPVSGMFLIGFSVFSNPLVELACIVASFVTCVAAQEWKR